MMPAGDKRGTHVDDLEVVLPPLSAAREPRLAP